MRDAALIACTAQPRGRSPRRRARPPPRRRGMCVRRVKAASPGRPAARAGRWGRAAAPGGCPRRGCPPRRGRRRGSSIRARCPVTSRRWARRPPGPRSRRSWRPEPSRCCRPARPRTCCSGAASRRRAMSCALGACLAAQSVTVDALVDSRRPAQARGQPADQQHRRDGRVGVVANGDRARSPPARRAEQAGRRWRRSARARGSTAARRDRPRRRAPSSAQARSIASCHTGSSIGVQQHRLRQLQQRVGRLGVAVGRPQQGRQVAHHERIGDAQQIVQVAIADLDDHGLA